MKAPSKNKHFASIRRKWFARKFPIARRAIWQEFAGACEPICRRTTQQNKMPASAGTRQGGAARLPFADMGGGAYNAETGNALAARFVPPGGAL
jgi:hypothetical protein